MLAEIEGSIAAQWWRMDDLISYAKRSMNLASPSVTLQLAFKAAFNRLVLPTSSSLLSFPDDTHFTAATASEGFYSFFELGDLEAVCDELLKGNALLLCQLRHLH